MSEHSHSSTQTLFYIQETFSLCHAQQQFTELSLGCPQQSWTIFNSGYPEQHLNSFILWKQDTQRIQELMYDGNNPNCTGYSSRRKTGNLRKMHKVFDHKIAETWRRLECPNDTHESRVSSSQSFSSTHWVSRFLRELSISSCLVPVSYTHLDVYKRQRGT